MYNCDPETKECITALQACHAACLQFATFDCLEGGILQVEANRIRLMLDCAEICQTAANFLIRDSDHYLRVCREAAVICEDLSSVCCKITTMKRVLVACNNCVSACRAIDS
jgi:hypothetical protein